MATTNVKCPICGTMNYNLYLDETGGWMECSACGSVTCSAENKPKKGVKIPVYEIKWMKEHRGKKNPCRNTKEERWLAHDSFLSGYRRDCSSSHNGL